MAMAERIQHQKQGSRFTLEVDGVHAVLTYQMEGARMVITHTVVPAQLRGQGLAAELTRAALGYAQSHDLKVVPACSYAAGFMQRHPEYAPLLE